MDGSRKSSYSRNRNKLERYSTDTFFGLEFSTTNSSRYKRRQIDTKPNILISGSNVILDYSISKNTSDLEEFETLFKKKRTNATFTLSKAIYRDDIRGVDANFNGDYTFLKFVGDHKILAQPPAGITYSPDAKAYKSSFFKQTPFIGITLPTDSSTTYTITNHLGSNSSESFSNSGILPLDYIKVNANTGSIPENRLYEVKNITIESDGTEIIEVDKPFQDVDMVGDSVFISVFKKEAIESGSNCYYAKRTMFDAKFGRYLEVGSLVECETGFEFYGRIKAARENYNIIHVPERIEGLKSEPFNYNECSVCPSTFSFSSDQEVEVANPTRESSGSEIQDTQTQVEERVNAPLRISSPVDLNYFFEDINLILVDGKIKINGENKNTFSARRGQRYKIDISHPSLAQAEDVAVFDGRNREPILQGLNFRGVPGQDKSRITYVASQNSEIILEPENLTLPSDVPTRGCTAPRTDYRSPPPDAANDPTWRKYVADQMKCCKCLLYGEARGETEKCQECAMWVAFNRQKDDWRCDNPDDFGGGFKGLTGCAGNGPGAVPRPERSYCYQAQDPGRWEGGWPNPNFKRCWCDGTDETNTSRDGKIRKRLNSMCNQLGLANWKRPPLVDPTGGANYFFKCGSQPSWMDCSVKYGRCRALPDNHGCTGCGNCFFQCDNVPKTCDWFEKRKNLSSIDITEPIIITVGPDDDINDIYSGYDPDDPNIVLVRTDEDFSVTTKPSLPEVPVAMRTSAGGGPLSYNGYYPLFSNAKEAIENSPEPDLVRTERAETTAGYHVHTLDGIDYYMPNGLVLGVNQFHGDYEPELRSWLSDVNHECANDTGNYRDCLSCVSEKSTNGELDTCAEAVAKGRCWEEFAREFRAPFSESPNCKQIKNSCDKVTADTPEFFCFDGAKSSTPSSSSSSVTPTPVRSTTPSTPRSTMTSSSMTPTPRSTPSSSPPPSSPPPSSPPASGGGGYSY